MQIKMRERRYPKDFTAGVAKTIRREFDSYDGKGRQLGASATVFPVDYVPFDGTEGRWTCDYSRSVCGRDPVPEPCQRFAFTPHALRGGEFYGASHRTHEFATEAERDAAVDRYFADAEKRALKNKARVA